jgi:hypothetical protein
VLIAIGRKLYTLLEGEVRVAAQIDGASVVEELARQCNVLRQTEIIEEIEVILLSAASLGDNPESRNYVGSPEK